MLSKISAVFTFIFIAAFFAAILAHHNLSAITALLSASVFCVVGGYFESKENL